MSVPLQQPGGGAYRALIICNSTYPADTSKLPKLCGPDVDGLQLFQAITNEAAGMFHRDNIRVLFEKDSGEIASAIERFFRSGKPGEVLLFYYSGHGRCSNQKLFLCGRNTETTKLLSTAVSEDLINDAINSSYAEVKILILDCCQSGMFKGDLAAEGLSGRGRYVLTATSPTNLAKDSEVEGKPSPFTQDLVDGLLGGAQDVNGDGFIELDDLYLYVCRVAREGPEPQRKWDGTGAIRIARHAVGTQKSHSHHGTREKVDDSNSTPSHDDQTITTFPGRDPTVKPNTDLPQRQDYLDSHAYIDDSFIDRTTRLTSIDAQRVAQFRANARPDVTARMPLQLSAVEFLKRANLIRDDLLTLAGVLLFGENPSAAVPTAIVQCSRFAGKTKDAEREKIDFNGTIPEQIGQAHDFVSQHARRGEVPVEAGPYAEPVYDYPMSNWSGV
jgi:hypothetical protein